MNISYSSQGSRSDILSSQDGLLIKALSKVRGPRRRPKVFEMNARQKQRLSMRRGLAEDPAKDPNGFERILGKSDLTSINFLARGLRAAAAVCRIKLPMEGGAAFGTGFLVGPRLMLTNNHVLASSAEAGQAEAEFGFEHDLDGVLAEPVQFNLLPDELFYTSPELDFTFVAVAPLSESAVPLDRYGRLPLLPISGKALPNEWVSIVQHPGGQPKQIAIQASQIIALSKKEAPTVNTDVFIHYSTDTEPGSSGSPVFNDQWQVVALHHKAVPSPASAKTPGSGHEEWIANEGVRVSAIFKHLERRRFESEMASAVLDRLAGALGLPPAARAPAIVATEKQYAPYDTGRWDDDGYGYDPDFLTETISLEDICKDAEEKGLTAQLLDGSGYELKYRHFSVVMNEPRCFSLITAVNIDGKRLKAIKRKDTWRPDARIDRKYQPDDEFYVQTKSKEKVYFSRGHQVRLLDPCWGTQKEADEGMQDTFHFTNAAPQFQEYNDIKWGNLEDYVLEKAQGTEKRITVFTGPVFLKDDPFYGKKRKGGPWQIPLSYWKVAVLQKTDDTIAAAAFIVGQTEYVKALYESKVFSGLRPYTVDEMKERGLQISIANLQETIAEGSALDFSMLIPFDAQGSLESSRQTQFIRSLTDIII